MKIRFENVGHSNASWEASCDGLDYDWFYKQVKSRGVMSRDLDFCLKKDNPKEGIVFAGFHNIGTFKIVEEE
jgi:hypothetical protein